MNIITPSEVVEYAFTPREEISPQSIRKAKIDVAAERFVRPRFGDDLYEKFADGEYSPFVDEFLKPAVAHYVRYVLIDELSIQLTDNGAVLFEKEDRDSQHSKSTLARDSGQSNQVGKDSSSTKQDTTFSETSSKDTKTITSGMAIREESVEDSGKTVEKRTGTETLGRESETKTDIKKNMTSEVNRTTKDVTVGDNTKDRNYQYHDSGQTVGVSRIGESKDKITENKTVNGTYGSDSADTENTTNTVAVDSTDTKVLNTTNDITVSKDSSRNSTNSTDQTTNQSISGYESGSKNVVGTNSQTSEREATQSSERRSSDDGSAQVARRQMRPATDSQRRIIRARALADANILMSKAVRYVERNAELFPEYEPQPRSIGRLVL